MGYLITMPVSPLHDRDALFVWASMPQQIRAFPQLSYLRRIAYSNARRIEEGSDFTVTYLALEVARQGLQGLYIRLMPSHHEPRQTKARFLSEKSMQGFLAADRCGWEEAKDVIVCYLNL